MLVRLISTFCLSASLAMGTTVCIGGRLAFFWLARSPSRESMSSSLRFAMGLVLGLLVERFDDFQGQVRDFLLGLVVVGEVYAAALQERVAKGDAVVQDAVQNGHPLPFEDAPDLVVLGGVGNRAIHRDA